MENKFTVSVRRQFKDRESGLKSSILRTILHKSKQENYDADKLSSLAREIENRVKYKELSEYTFYYLGESYKFKVDSMDMLIQGEDNVCLQEYSEDFVSSGMDKFAKRFDSQEKYDNWINKHPISPESNSFFGGMIR